MNRVWLSPAARRRWRALGSLSLTAFFLTSLRAGMCDKSVTDPEATIVRVETTPAEVELAPGATRDVFAYPYDDANRRIGGREITWQSSNTSVVTVTSLGVDKGARVTAVGTGDAEILASVGGQVGRIPVTVAQPTVPVARVLISPGSVTVRLLDSASVAAGGFDANDRQLEGRVVTFAMLDSSVALVRPTAGGGGVVIGVKEGTTSLRATIDGVSATMPVTVAGGPRPRSVRASVDTVKVVAGAEATVTFTAHDAAGEALPDTAMSVSIASTQVARFTAAATSATGRTPVRITGVAAGTTTVTAEVSGARAVVPVVVTAAPVTSGDSLVVNPLGVFTVKRLADGTTQTFPGMLVAGDHEENGDKSLQGFASYLFDALPAGAAIDRAILTVTLDEEFPNAPFTLGALVAEPSTSSTLNEGAVSTSAVSLATAATPRTVKVDIAPLIRAARANGAISQSLRFRFTQLGNNNGKTDYIGFTADPLTIYYSK